MSIGADIGALTMTVASRVERGSAVEFVEIPLTDTKQLAAHLHAYRGQVVPSVGSGAWRLACDIETTCGVRIEKHREPLCVWLAIRNLLDTSDDNLEAYSFKYQGESDAYYPISAPFRDDRALLPLRVSVTYNDLCDNFPLLLVNVKTGTSIYRVDSPTEFVRVGGASIGSSTITGLSSALIDATQSNSLTSTLSESRKIQGSHCRTDLLVEDIYGGDCVSIGLPGSIIASCFGKADETSSEHSKPDLAKSLIDLICINTAQLAHLHAQLNNCTTALIVGSVGGSDEQLAVSECIQRVFNILNKSSAGVSAPIRPIFFCQSKYLASLGAMLLGEQKSGSSEPKDTATISDLVTDETYTKLRVATTPPP